MTEPNGFFTWIFIASGIAFWGSEGSREKRDGPGQNMSLMTNFILVGFSEHPGLQVILFILFLGIFFMTLAWNLGLIVLIAVESHLHSPMYFFLGNLSFIDLSYTSSIAPKMLCDFLKEQKTISFAGCASQLFFFLGMGGAECCLLAAMASVRLAAMFPSALRSPRDPASACAWPSRRTPGASSPDWARPALYSGSTAVGHGHSPLL